MKKNKFLHMKSFPGEMKDFENLSFHRILKDSDKEEQYKRKLNCKKSTLHWGQRKLLLSEIEFLTLHGHKSKLVVYAGAAPGTHMISLSKLFPEHEFHLYDPRKFTVQESDKIKTNVQYYTLNDAEKYKNIDTLFISDIRVSPEEEVVLTDMKMQEEWVKIMKPKASMLKFRLPWCIDIYNKKSTNREKYDLKYLKGDIYIQVWGPLTTTETRLIIDNDKLEEKIYKSCKYENQMFYFNKYTRLQYYKRPHNLNINKVEGLCNCYDCTSEIYILYEYFKKIHNITDKEVLEYGITELIKKISNILTFKNKNLLQYWVYFQKNRPNAIK